MVPAASSIRLIATITGNAAATDAVTVIGDADTATGDSVAAVMVAGGHTSTVAVTVCTAVTTDFMDTAADTDTTAAIATTILVATVRSVSVAFNPTA